VIFLSEDMGKKGDFHGVSWFMVIFPINMAIVGGEVLPSLAKISFLGVASHCLSIWEQLRLFFEPEY
jgi:hypothetical protein